MDPTQMRDTIVDSVNLQDVAKRMLNLHMQYLGGRLNILCPFPDHNDHTLGSCVVNERFGYCFACNESFNAIDLVMHTQHCTFLEAVRMISDFYGLDIDFSRDANAPTPFIISAEVFRFAGISDTTAFKKTLSEDAETAFRCLAVYIAAAMRKYRNAIKDKNLPTEVTAIVKRRIKILEQADSSLAEWKQLATERPLQIK